MEAKAIGRYLRVTPRKARYVLDTVRGKSAKEALATLKFVPNEAARYIEHVLESAVANAEHNYAMDREILRVSTAFADVGPSLKRIHPRAMGRAFRILHRTSHITVAVSEDETLRKTAAKPKGRRPARRKTEADAATALPKAAKRSAAKPKAETVAAPVENANPEATPEEKTD
jgi:large subunit ribosomal protein L22